MKDKVTIKDKLNCWRNGHILLKEDWVWNWGDGQEWACNTCLRCGAKFTKDNGTEKVRMYRNRK